MPIKSFLGWLEYHILPFCVPIKYHSRDLIDANKLSKLDRFGIAILFGNCLIGGGCNDTSRDVNVPDGLVEVRGEGGIVREELWVKKTGKIVNT